MPCLKRALSRPRRPCVRLLLLHLWISLRISSPLLHLVLSLPLPLPRLLLMGRPCTGC